MKKLFILLILITGLNEMQGQITNTDQEVRQIYDFVFGEDSGKKLGPLSKLDKQRANLFLADMIDKSCLMSFTETLLKSAVNPASNVQTLIRNFVLKHYNGCHDEIKEGKIYETVRNTLKLKWKSAFEIRIQTGEW